MDRSSNRYRLDVAARIVAAVGGGYAVAALATMFLGAALPMDRADAVLTGTLLSFVVCAVAVIWVFAASSASRAWLGLLLCAALLGTGRLAFGT